MELDGTGQFWPKKKSVTENPENNKIIEGGGVCLGEWANYEIFSAR